MKSVFIDIASVEFKTVKDDFRQFTRKDSHPLALWNDRYTSVGAEELPVKHTSSKQEDRRVAQNASLADVTRALSLMRDADVKVSELIANHLWND